MDSNTNDGMLCPRGTNFLSDRACPVVSMLMVNSESLTPSNYSSVFEASGITDLIYSPSQANFTPSEWPTLGDLIDAGTRFVVFMDYGAVFSEVPYIIDGLFVLVM